MWASNQLSEKDLNSYALEARDHALMHGTSDLVYFIYRITLLDSNTWP